MIDRGEILAPGVLSALLIFGSYALFLPPADFARTKPTTGTSWNVTYLAGPRSTLKGARLKATFSEESLICEGSKARFSIPVASIVDVSSNSRRRYPMWDAQVKAWSVWAVATQGYGLVFFPYGVPLLLASLASKSRDYLLDIVWREGGIEQNILLAVGKDDYSSFLAELNRATGKEWKDLEAEWLRVEQEIKRQQDNKIAVKLEQPTRVSGINLKPGVYQIVFLPRQGNLGELYFFKGHAADTTKIAVLTVATLGLAIGEADVAHKEIATSTEAELQAEPGGVSTTQVIYKRKNGATTISEIHAGKKIFRLP